MDIDLDQYPPETRVLRSSLDDEMAAEQYGWIYSLDGRGWRNVSQPSTGNRWQGETTVLPALFGPVRSWDELMDTYGEVSTLPPMP